VSLRGCGLFVTQDTGEVLSYAAFSDPGSCHTASVEQTQISLAAGGVQTIELDFGVARAGANYFVLGSLADSLPGFSVGNVLIPLVVDAYFNITIKNPNTLPFGASLGALDGSGRATATFTLPPGVDPGLAGLVLYHSAVVFSLGVVDASNPVPLTLVP
jgi:hypothetical protein